jgi:hypothetical protein
VKDMDRNSLYLTYQEHIDEDRGENEEGKEIHHSIHIVINLSLNLDLHSCRFDHMYSVGLSPIMLDYLEDKDLEMCQIKIISIFIYLVGHF